MLVTEQRMTTDVVTTGAARRNRWHGLGRRHIEIPRPVMKDRVQNDSWLKQLHISSLGYYPKASGHYTYRKKGLDENILFFCVDGHGWFKSGDRKYRVGPNEMFILPQHTEHAYGGSDEDPWSIYWMHFGGEQLAHFNSLQAVQAYFQPSFVKGGGEVVALFSKMYQTLELGYSTDNLLFANMCLSHFLSLFLYNSRHAEVQAAPPKMDTVDSAIHYMHEHINENLSLIELSRIYNYSPSRFSSLFKQKTGYAPIDYFIQMKMQKACRELDFSDRPSKEIAFDLGFEDPCYFSRRFTKVMGMSPTQYRSIKKD
ncbi:AraC family transcriptional regulator [Paraflavisolibacter sp. H34]|uniref:AraC family transcriptional regulator n=1 Tax=Huijunlia imazamoxiresistens TaxID=3127457 RepID=UPI0030197D7B